STDSAHADATNNIASALSTLAPADRVRVTTSLGLMPSDTLQGKDTTKRNVTAGVGRKTLAAVDTVVEALFRRTLEVEPTHRWGHNNLGLHLHYRGRNAEAAEIFELALDLYPEDAELHFHLGVALQSAGNGQDAARSFMAALEFDPQNVGAALNLAALHHRYGKIRDAVDLYRNTVHMIDSDDDELMVMLRNNLGTALYQMGDHTLAKEEHRAVLALLGAQVKEKPTRGGANGERDVYIDTMVNMHRQASCDWRDWENLLSDLKREVDMHQLGAERPPSLLPFDSLLLPYPIDAKWRRKIAEAHSRRYTKKTTDMPSGVEYDEHYRASVENRTYPGNAGVDIHPMRDGEAKSDDSTNRGRERGVYMGKGRAPTLDIGFLGHDFSEHPTAHMMEGAFVWQKRFSTTPVNNSQGGGRRSAFGGGRQWQRPPYSAYSYGGGGSSSDREDSSSNATNRSRTGTTSAVRESIQLLASSFVDLYPVGHAEASAKILGDGVNILLDLQGHTLGGRSEIAAARPAPIQASYLIFPGTSGAPYVDYLLADRHVIPPEHVNHYSESLVLLPWTYQTNFYEDRRWTAASEGVTATDATARMNNTERRALRRAHSLPEDLSFVVLANFNKVDKLGPESFYLWMQIMRRVPRAVLWLLEPSSMQRENEAICKRLGDEAEGYGVHRRRLMFAKRVPRTQHLSRHAAADLFLDTLTYGAHSTATDALAGGLPFLTLAGG
ncbi:unnamed protein product, partial [Sphacelaria rigidula]